MGLGGHKRLCWVMAGGLALVALASFGLPRLRPRAPSPGAVVAIAPADVDGDGDLELLALYRAAEDADSSILVAVDAERLRPLWVARTVPTNVVPAAPVPLLLVSEDDVLVTGRLVRPGQGRQALAVHDLSAGRQRWSWDLPEGRDWNVGVRVSADGDQIFALTVRETENAARLTALRRGDGAEVWQAEVGHWPGSIVPDGELLLVRATDGLSLVERETGSVVAAPGVRAGTLLDGRYRAVHADATGFVIGDLARDGTFEPTLDPESVPIRLPPGADPQTAVAFYAGRDLIAGAAVGADALGLQSIALDGSGVRWELAPDDRFGLLVANDNWRRVAPAGSGFLINPARFAPAILSRELNPEQDAMKLALLDFERGRVVWESRVFAQRPPGLWADQIVQHQGQFLMVVPMVDDLQDSHPRWERGVLLNVDGWSGGVVGAWQITDRDGEWAFPSPGHTPRPWWWRPPYLFGFEGDRLWIADLEVGRMLWSTPGGLRIVNRRAAVEALLGSLPGD